MYKEKTLLKFNIDKSYKFFPGNSIIKLIGDNQLLYLIKTVKREMEESNLFDKFIFLPEDSYHVTICDLITYDDLQTNPNFNGFIFKDEKEMQVIDRKIIDLLRDVNLNLDVRMKVEKIKSRRLSLTPKTDEDRIKLNAFRKTVYDLLHLPMNEDYKFHCSIAYQLKELTLEEEEKINNLLSKLNEKHLENFEDIEINDITLVAFNDMSEFRDLSKGRKGLGFFSV